MAEILSDLAALGPFVPGSVRKGGVQRHRNKAGESVEYRTQPMLNVRVGGRRVDKRFPARLSKSGRGAFIGSFHAIFGDNAQGRLHGDNLKAWNYLESRKAMMDYGNLRRRLIPIGSGMLECRCKLVIGSRLMGPGMHWRFNNRLHIAALCAALKSNLQICA